MCSRPLPDRPAKADAGRDYPGRSRHWEDTPGIASCPGQLHRSDAAARARLRDGKAGCPIRPLVHALSRHLEWEQAPEALLGATWLSELSRILPELLTATRTCQSPWK